MPSPIRDTFDSTLRRWRDLSGEKPFLSTELCVNHSAWQLRSYRLAFQMAQQYHKTLTIADAVAVCYCWLLLDVGTAHLQLDADAVCRGSREWAHACGGQPSNCGAMVPSAAASGPAWYASDAQSDHPDLLASAYRDNAGHVTAVLLNRSTEPLAVSMHGQGTRFTAIERVSPSQANAVGSLPEAGAPILMAPG